jgi:hypothetical protein
MPAIVDVSSMVMSGALLWAGLEKCRSIEGIANAIRAVAFDSHAVTLGWVLAMSEVALGLAVVLAPAAWPVQLGIVLLALLFAAGGAWALATGRQIRCSCFGSLGNQKLGAWQLWALVPWLGAVALLHGQAPELGIDDAVFGEEAVGRLSIVALALAALRTPAVVAAWHAARSDRHSARQMLIWLP